MAFATDTQLLDRITAILGTVDGLKTAPRHVPRKAFRVELPMVLAMSPGGFSNNRKISANEFQKTRIFELWLLVMKYQNGIEGEAQEAAEPFIERIEDAFLMRPTLALNGAKGLCRDATPSGTSGVVPVIYPEGSTASGDAYAGIIFNLAVTTIRVVNRRAGG